MCGINHFVILAYRWLCDN